MKKILCLCFLILVIVISCKKSNESENISTRDLFIESQTGIKLINAKEDLSMGNKEGNEKYMLYKPKDCAVDSEGNIYILDSSIDSIRKYDSKGIFEREIGQTGQGPGDFLQPAVIRIYADHLYVYDSMLKKIEIFDLITYSSNSLRLRNKLDRFFPCEDGKIYIGYFTQKRIASGELRQVYYINLYDPKENDESRVYTLNKFRSRTIRKEKKGKGTLWITETIVYPWQKNSEDHIYLLNFDENKVDVISPKGSILFSFDYYLNNSNSKTRSKTHKNNQEIFNYWLIPNTLTIDDSDRIWISFLNNPSRDISSENTYFNVFSSEGEYLFSAIIEETIYSQPNVKKCYVYFFTVILEDFPSIKRYFIDLDD